MGIKKTSSWRSPSNIALVKYWGKKEVQIPANASLSFTLSNCYTETSVLAEEIEDKEAVAIKVFLNGLLREDFRDKIYTLLERLGSEAHFLKGHYLEVKTMNSFPHSSGIASSASGMSALVLCLLSLKEAYTAQKDPDFFKTASRWARLASGSAGRSLYGGMVLWGNTEVWPQSNNEYAVPLLEDVHPVFHDFKDFVLLIEKGSKAVSSSAGHGLMQGHPFAEARFAEAQKNMTILKEALRTGNLEAFGALVEREALQLHAMMMTSQPYYLLMKANTVAAIEKIWELRRIKNIPAYFTLDAGANVHLLFPREYEHLVKTFTEHELKPLLHEGEYIEDEVGTGPEKLF